VRADARVQEVYLGGGVHGAGTAPYAPASAS